MFNLPIASAFFGGWPGWTAFDLAVSGPHNDMIGRDRQPGDQGFDTNSKSLGKSDQSLQRRRELAVLQLGKPADSEVGPGNNGLKGQPSVHADVADAAAEGGEVERGGHRREQ